MAEHPKFKSMGAFYQADVSPGKCGEKLSIQLKNVPKCSPERPALLQLEEDGVGVLGVLPDHEGQQHAVEGLKSRIMWQDCFARLVRLFYFLA